MPGRRFKWGDWEIHPCLGFGPLRFGMSQAECRALIGTSYQHEPQARRDRFDDGDFELEYDESGRLEYLSVGSYADRMPTLHGEPLLDRPRGQVLACVERLTKLRGVYHDELSVLYQSLQMELWQCYGSGDGFASVNLGRPGYFD